MARALWRRGAQFLIPLALLFLVLWLKLSPWAWVETFQHKAFDMFQVLRPRPYEAVPVRILDIDDETLARLGQWPWPRSQVAKVVERLDALGAAVAAFDIVFSEPDRTSPARVASLWPREPGLDWVKERLKTLPDHDALLARAIAQGRVVTGFVLTGQKNGARPALKASFSYAGDNPLAYVDAYEGAVVNLPVLEKGAAGNGNFGFLPESDGIIRRPPLLFSLDKALYPSLAAEALRVAQGAAGFAVKSSGASGESSFGQHTGISRVKIGAYKIPTDAKGRFWVYYTESAAERTIPLWRIFEDDFDPEQVSGCIIFLGTSASGLKDLRVTPLSPAAPGVEVHANVVEQVLLGRFLQRPDWAPGAELLYMLVMGLALLLLLPRCGILWSVSLTLGGLAGALAFSWHAFSSWRYLVDPVFPCLTILLIYMSSSLISYLKTEAERRQIKGAFSRYMSPALIDELARHPEKLKLGGEMRNMSLLFCDIRGFTTISEKLDPQGLTHLINSFFTPMTEIILERKGTIDKYIGDCIMAFWNAPLDDSEHARHACQAALAMQKKVEELDARWEAASRSSGRPHLPVRIGLGLNTGSCCVGNMGSDQRFDYSALGDEVNLASRLEGQSKNYGVGIVIGPNTREQVPDYAALELDLIRVKGKTVPVRIFALLGDESMARQEEFQSWQKRHDEMLGAYRSRQWEKARALLAICRSRPWSFPVLYALYEERLKAFEAAPPGPDWDGTFTALSK